MNCACEAFAVGSQVQYNNPNTGVSFQGSVIKHHSCKAMEALTLENNGGNKFVVFGDKIRFASAN